MVKLVDKKVYVTSQGTEWATYAEAVRAEKISAVLDCISRQARGNIGAGFIVDHIDELQTAMDLAVTDLASDIEVKPVADECSCTACKKSLMHIWVLESSEGSWLSPDTPEYFCGFDVDGKAKFSSHADPICFASSGDAALMLKDGYLLGEPCVVKDILRD